MDMENVPLDKIMSQCACYIYDYCPPSCVVELHKRATILIEENKDLQNRVEHLEGVLLQIQTKARLY